MVKNTRIVLLVAFTLACVLQNVACSSIGLASFPNVHIEAQVLRAVETLQSQANNLVDQLHQKTPDCVTSNGDLIEKAYSMLKIEEEKMNKMNVDLDMKYAVCSARQLEAVHLAFSIAEEQLMTRCSAQQNSAFNKAVQHMLSFYTSDKSLIFSPCLPTSAPSTDEQLSQAEKCVDAHLAQATNELTASEAAMNVMLHEAAVKDEEGTTSCVETSEYSIVQAVEVLSDDLSKCVDDIDEDSAPEMVPVTSKTRVKRGWFKKSRKRLGLCRPRCGFKSGFFSCVCRK